MPRSNGNDLCEIFGYTPDDTSTNARKQWKRQECPFVKGTCVKHSHPQQNGKVVVYGSCSVINKTRTGKEEVIICPQRLYADNYRTLRNCIADATGRELPIYLAKEYSKAKKRKDLPEDFFVLIGHNSGKEVSLSNPGIIELSLDWVMARMKMGKLAEIIPCEVQSIDITGNYRANWKAYAEEASRVPDSAHGMNWANVWKRLIPQLILKSSISSTSSLCSYGMYFVVPDRVYIQLEKLMGKIQTVGRPVKGTINVMTYALGSESLPGAIRSLAQVRTVRMLGAEFAKSFASGEQLPLGSQLDEKVSAILSAL